MSDRRTTRDRARLVICPRCDAYPGEKCWGRWRKDADGIVTDRWEPRDACHAERHLRAIALGAKPIHSQAPRT